MDAPRVEVEEAGLEAGSSQNAVQNADDALLAQLGYKSEFKRHITVSADTHLMEVLLLIANYTAGRVVRRGTLHPDTTHFSHGDVPVSARSW